MSQNYLRNCHLPKNFDFDLHNVRVLGRTDLLEIGCSSSENHTKAEGV